MKDYLKLKKELEKEKSKLAYQLETILEKNGYDGCFAWFNWNEENLTIVWDNTVLPRQIINDFEKTFGEINSISTPRNPISNHFIIEFQKRDDE